MTLSTTETVFFTLSFIAINFIVFGAPRIALIILLEVVFLIASFSVVKGSQWAFYRYYEMARQSPEITPVFRSIPKGPLYREQVPYKKVKSL